MTLTHHAYIYEGRVSDHAWLVGDAGGRMGLARGRATAEGLAPASGGLWEQQYESFGIDDARALTQRAMMRSSSGGQLFVVSTGNLTPEAQNALLKLFEEPQEGVVFVFNIPRGVALPTVRSRTMYYPGVVSESSIAEGAAAAEATDAKLFLQSGAKERSSMIAALLKDEDSTRERVVAFVNALEAQLYQGGIDRAVVQRALEEISFVRTYLTDRSASYKMLLEHLAVTV